MTIDHVVPARPGPWFEQLGGNALYAAAGARLWLDPRRIGVVARRGPNLPGRLESMMAEAGLTTAGLVRAELDNMVEWMIYEEDGGRRNLPRLPELRDLRFDRAGGEPRYLARKAAVSAEAADIPQGWLPAGAIHLSPQVLDRHPVSVAALAGQAGHLSVDPSPSYSRGCTVEDLAHMLQGATAFLPSEVEIAHLAPDGDWATLARRVRTQGFKEVVIKLGRRGALVDGDSGPGLFLPALDVAAVDVTGAGDSFCGAYLANRLIGETPAEATRRAVATAGLVVACSGVEAAFRLSPGEAREARALCVDA